jgi:hypothetical protein
VQVSYANRGRRGDANGPLAAILFANGKLIGNFDNAIASVRIVSHRRCMHDASPIRQANPRTIGLNSERLAIRLARCWRALT